MNGFYFYIYIYIYIPLLENFLCLTNSEILFRKHNMIQFACDQVRFFLPISLHYDLIRCSSFSRSSACSFQDFIAFSLRLHSLRNCDMGGLPVGNSSESKLEQGSAVVKSTPDGKPKKKICCACPDTKKLRDECIVEHGEEFCGKWIEAHRKCLRAEGFNV